MPKYLAVYDVSSSSWIGDEYKGGWVSNFKKELQIFEAENDSNSKEIAEREILNGLSKKYSGRGIKLDNIELKLVVEVRIVQDNLSNFERNKFIFQQHPASS